MNRKTMVGAAFAGVLAGCCCDVVPPAVPAFKVDFASTNGIERVHNFRERTPSAVRMTDRGAVLEFTGVRNCKPGEEWGEDTLWGLDTRRFKVTPNAEYCVVMRLAGSLPAGYGKVVSVIRWFDRDGKPIMTVDQLGRDEQLAFTVRFPTAARGGATESVACSRGVVPKDAFGGQLSFKVDNPNLKPGEKVEFREYAYYEHVRGERWTFDDIDAPTVTLLNGNRLKDATEPLRFRIDDATGVDWGSLECSIDGEPVSYADLKREGDVFVYEPKAPWAKDSVHGVEVSVSDSNGVRGYDCAYAAYAAGKPAHRFCSLRDDGMMLVDGKPFFPLGLFSIHANDGNNRDLDRCVREMCENGLNVAHTYMVRGRSGPQQDAEYDALVAACGKHGMLFYAEPAHRRLEPRERSRRMAENIFRGRGFREVLGWGVGDDTSVNTSPDELKRLHRFCKACDPGALTISADVIKSPSQQADYIPYADILLLESYPIRSPEPNPDEMAKAAEAIDNAWAAVDIAGVKGTSVMALPQCFKGWSSWKRYPTKDEIRAQAFIAICCRARGLLYYTSYGHKGNEGPFNDPTHKREFFEVSREIAALMPSLVTRDAARQPKVSVLKGKGKNVLGCDAVRALLKEDGLLVVANTSQLPVTAEVVLPDGRKIVRDLAAYGAFAERTSAPAQ